MLFDFSFYFYFATFQATPWTATITDKVQNMQARMKSMDQLQTRTVKAEEELDRVMKELEIVSGQACTLSTNKK